MCSNETTKKKDAKLIKRKFPGPAGLLPEVKNVNLASEEESRVISSQTVFYSQSSVNTFSDATWLEMLDDLRKNDKDRRFLLDKYNVEWIINKSKTGFLNDHKIPFLIVKIKRLETIGNNKKPNLILCDRTGEISAVITDELYEQFGEFLTVNSVLILKGCSVLLLTTNINVTKKKKLYIVIGLNNLLRIYGFLNDQVGIKCKKKVENDFELQIVTVNEFNFDDLIKEIEDIGNYLEIKRDFKDNVDFNVNFDVNIDANLDVDLDINLDVDLEEKKENFETPSKKFKSNQKDDFIILSQSVQKDVNDLNVVREALNDIDSTNFFDDF